MPAAGRLAAVAAALVGVGCGVPEPPATVDCRTGDQLSCERAADAALAEASRADARPTRLTVTSGAMPDCVDPRPNVCPWNVAIEFGRDARVDVPVMRVSSGDWLPLTVVTPTS